MDLANAREKLRHRLIELQECCSTRSPWVFLGASAYIEYLAKLAGMKYKDFVSIRLAKVRPEYADFTYRSGKRDLPEQMCHVLRCGIVHSLSLMPDDRARSEGGRDRSIVLCHRQPGAVHLSPCSRGAIDDAALFVAEEFVEDLVVATNNLFDEASRDATLEANMTNWLSKHPFISGGF